MKMTNMTQGNPFRTIFFFAVPMILSNLFQQLYMVMDSVIVGKYVGQNALAAVGGAGSITAVFVQLATGLALGCGIVISQYFGAGRTDEIRLCATTAACFSTAVGFVSFILVRIYAEPLLLWVNTPKEIVPQGTAYLRFYFLGSVPMFLYNSLGSVYTALGNSKKPLKFLIISSVVNVALDYLFLVCFQWGIAGAAVATALSQWVAMAWALADIPRLLSEFPVGRDALGKRRFFDGRLLVTMLRFALPSAVQQSVVSVGSVVVQATINSFGAAVMAGTAAASKVINLVITIPINYANAYSGYVGQNIGAKQPERIWPGLRSSLLCCGSISFGLTILLELFAEPAIRSFLPEAGEEIVPALKVGVEYIRVVGACLVVFTVYMLVKATFKGSGDMGWFISVTLLSFFVRLVITVGFAGTFGVGVIWWGFNAGWFISLIPTVGRYVQGGWKKKAILL